MGAWGTKVQTTTLSALEGDIINSLDPVVGVDPTKNAPSISVVNTALGTLDTAVDTINDNLAGFKFYPTGTNLVALISDDSFYTDSDGNYVIWGTPTANQLVEDNPNTYKSVPSTEDCRGKAGADTVVPFKGKQDGCLIVSDYNSSSGNIRCEISSYIDGVSDYQIKYFEGYGSTYIENDYVKAQTNQSQSNYKITYKKGIWINKSGTLVDARTAPITAIVGNSQRIAMVSSS